MVVTGRVFDQAELRRDGAGGEAAGAPFQGGEQLGGTRGGQLEGPELMGMGWNEMLEKMMESNGTYGSNLHTCFKMFQGPVLRRCV